MYQAIIVVHVLLGLGVISLVLLQQGKGADAGAAFGSASGSVFGAQGASSFLSRATAILATLFFATSLGLAVLSGYEEGEVSLMEEPVIEEIQSDLPLVDGTAPESDSIPVVKEDVPAAIEEQTPGLLDTVTEEIQSAVEDTKKAVSDTLETTTEKDSQ